MTENLPISAVNESTYAVTVTFYDDNGDLVTPDSATWTLRDINGSVINSRLDVVITPLASTVTIVLQGDDLKFSEGSLRVLHVDSLYTSSLGSGLPLKQCVNINIEDC